MVELVALSNVNGLLALHCTDHDAVVSLERIDEVLLLRERAARSSNRLDTLAEAVICSGVISHRGQRSSFTLT